ncbi:MAG TPA: serine hydrolase domain-containing protein [Bryobacteraceae bacterium]|nr:serine hydrolase domain-containing protein [Bryobacteraceae bacterium]
MRRFCLGILLSLTWGLAAAQSATADPGVKGAERVFDAWMEEQVAYRGLPGVAVGVVSDQQLVWAKGYGYADTAAHTPMTATTKFRMASHSKLFTATAIMQLRDQGKVRLDDPVEKYLPWFKVKPAEPDDPPITIEELLTHSSGLSREAGAHWVDYKFPDAAELKAYLASSPAIYSPQVRWKYSNVALSIAGAVVETVSGEKYADYVQHHIFDPLGMKDSSVDRDLPGLAVGYGRRMPDGSRTKMPFVDAKAMGPATGITSTVEDMAKFVSLQFRKGSPVLSTAGLREMHRVRMLENDWTRGNAIGFAVERTKDRVYVGHGGSYPGYKTQTLMQLDDKVGVIVLTNGDDSNPSDMAQHLMQIVGAAVAKAAPKKSAAAWDPAWGRFAGLYRSANGDTAVVELNNELVTFNPVGSSPEQQSELVPIGNGQFRLEAPSGGSAVGEVVRFVPLPDGTMRMYMGGSYSDRVNPR